LSQLFHTIVLSPVPLVLHNGWLDLLFLYHACHAPLPTSWNTLIADLAEILDSGGVFDTKAIARYQHNEEHSYLEYIYKKSLLSNQLSGRISLELPRYPRISVHAIDPITLPVVPIIPQSDLASVKICPNFAVSLVVLT